MQRIDFERLAVLLLPSRMRGVRLMSLVRALVAPLVSLSERRMREREERMFWLRTTGQRRLLRYALNRWFGVSCFEIEDATARGSWLTVSDESDNDRPTMIDGGTTLYDEASVVGEYIQQQRRSGNPSVCSRKQRNRIHSTGYSKSSAGRSGRNNTGHFHNRRVSAIS